MYQGYSLYHDDERDIAPRHFGPRIPFKPRAPVWVTGQGNSLSIDEMEDDHLQNTINYLVRRKQQWERAALDAAEHGVDLGEMIVNRLTVSQWLANFYHEVKRRQET